MSSKKQALRNDADAYGGLIGEIGELLEVARRTAVRAVNSLMTATYWEVGRRIVEFEQQGKRRAGYGEELLKRVSVDLSERFGRGFGLRNIIQMRAFYLGFSEIVQTASAQLGAGEMPEVPSVISPQVLDQFSTTSHKTTLAALAYAFPLPWSHYVLLLKVHSLEARDFYHTEALRGGWSVRQLDRQMNSLFYERAALSKNKASMLRKGSRSQPGDALTAEESIRDPLVLEFLNLRDEYSESDMEAALVRHLETFLLELGDDFTFVGRQRRLRLDDEWYRVDLLFFHRRLRCLVIVDLKLGKFTHADAGQMLLYLSYAKEHWTLAGENPPVGIILCSSVGENLVRYTLDTLPSKVMAREYKLALPDEGQLARELAAARNHLERQAKS
jgi:predicted nuclease of restriction endonuclease-like (RecB) superfamily